MNIFMVNSSETQEMAHIQYRVCGQSNMLLRNLVLSGCMYPVDHTDSV